MQEHERLYVHEGVCDRQDRHTTCYTLNPDLIIITIITSQISVALRTLDGVPDCQAYSKVMDSFEETSRVPVLVVS
jgi:hypothetical protein